MKYLSLFSGVGGFEIGISNATDGNWECVGFSEIDKHSIKTYKKHFPNHKELGDITKINANQLPDFDMLCGGFPCQTFSIAGKRRGFEDTRGTMFFEIARILETKKPRLVLLENVKGLLNHNKGETFKVILETLDELGYECQWMVFNSKFFGVPQNRERVFIIGSLREECRPEILLIGGEIKKTYFDESYISSCLDGNYGKGPSKGFGGRGRQLIAGTLRTHKNGQGFREMQEPNISPCIPARAREDGSGQPIVAIPVLTPDRPEKRQNGRRFKTNGEPSFTLTGQDIHGIAIMDLYNGKEHTDRSPTLTEPHHTTIRVREGMKIRRLTPVECERLQGFPDNWTEGVSDTQRYKQMGNAVTTKVIETIVKKMREVLP